jgi:DNA polymerase III epsilon subunit-like protein
MLPLEVAPGPALVFVDLEASGLINGFPTEVAWIRFPDRTEYSALIRPDPSWLEYGTWDTSAETLTGLTLEDLEHAGRLRGEIAADLLRDLGGQHLFVSGGHHDVEWLHMIVEPQRLELQDFRGLLSSVASRSTWSVHGGMPALERALRELRVSSELRHHRALDDARMMLMSFELALAGPSIF